MLVEPANLLDIPVVHTESDTDEDCRYYEVISTCCFSLERS